MTLAPLPYADLVGSEDALALLASTPAASNYRHLSHG